MADQNTSLPIRTEADGTDERLHAKIVDGADPSLRMTVDSDLNAHIEMHGNDPAGVDRVMILSEEGRSSSNGDYDAALNSKPSSNATILHDRVASPTEVDQNFRPTGVASSVDNAKCADVAIRDEAGNPFTSSNPLPVTLVDSEGVEINNYLQATAIAAAATDNHDYTVTALKTLKLAKIDCSASGKIKAQIQVETGVATGIFTTYFTQFNSTANPNLSFDVKELITVAAGVKVRAAITNLDNQAQNLYSTISGHEI